MGEKNITTPPGRGAKTDEFNPADEPQERRQKEVDKRDDGTLDGHEEGDRRRLIGKRHSRALT